MKNIADNIRINWDWLKKKLGDDNWSKFLADCQTAFDQFNTDKDFSSFNTTILDSLSNINKVLSNENKITDFLGGCKMGTNKPAPTQDDDLVQNSVDELAKKIAEEKPKPQVSQTN